MREQNVKDVEAKILEPCFRYLVEHGLENTSVRDLCKEMNVSSGSIYYWFEDKNDIYISVIKYGITQVVTKLFAVCFAKMAEPEIFFKTFLEDVDKYKKELRLIFQATTSPVYGPVLRKDSMNYKSDYSGYIEKLSNILGCSTQIMATVIYGIMSILSDYIVWEDSEVSEMLLNDLYYVMKLKIEKEKGGI